MCRQRIVSSHTRYRRRDAVTGVGACRRAPRGIAAGADAAAGAGVGVVKGQGQAAHVKRDRVTRDGAAGAAGDGRSCGGEQAVVGLVSTGDCGTGRQLLGRDNGRGRGVGEAVVAGKSAIAAIGEGKGDGGVSGARMCTIERRAADAGPYDFAANETGERSSRRRGGQQTIVGFTSHG